jgi:hypothetical protein
MVFGITVGFRPLFIAKGIWIMYTERNVFEHLVVYKVACRLAVDVVNMNV